jgi:hypothetical protein
LSLLLLSLLLSLLLFSLLCSLLLASLLLSLLLLLYIYNQDVIHRPSIHGKISPTNLRGRGIEWGVHPTWRFASEKCGIPPKMDMLRGICSKIEYDSEAKDLGSPSGSLR